MVRPPSKGGPLYTSLKGQTMMMKTFLRVASVAAVATLAAAPVRAADISGAGATFH